MSIDIKQKPERVKPRQPWRCDGEDRELEVASLDSEEAVLQARSRYTGDMQFWGRAPVDSMLTLPSWTFLGDGRKDEGRLIQDR